MSLGESIYIKIKKSDSTIVKVQVYLQRDSVKDLKERAFAKERELGKTIRLIYQGKVLQDNDMLSKYSKFQMVLKNFIDLKDGVFVHAFITEAIHSVTKKDPTEQTMDGGVN